MPRQHANRLLDEIDRGHGAAGSWSCRIVVLQEVGQPLKILDRSLAVDQPRQGVAFGRRPAAPAARSRM
jgi:hypothetical protein